MYQSIPQTPSHTRVFTACLLSFMILIAPIASVAAATIRATGPRVNKTTKKRLSATERLEAALFEPALPVIGPVITATKVDSFPSHPSGQAEPGDAITYDVNVSNAGADATNVQFTDTIDANTTLVPGSLKVSPLAFADAYVAEKDVALSVSAPGVLTNDTGTPAPTAVPIAAGPTTQGGTVTLNADGSFNYTPPAAFTGSDTFTYTATNGLTPNDTATVTITVDARPAVTTTTPTNSATNQATNINIVVNFSEAVNATTSSFTIECPAPGNLQPFTVSGSGTSAITLDPTADLPAGTTCKVTVIANQISDTDTNDPPDNLSADFIFSFTTDAAPSVSTTTPTNGATGVAANTNIVVNFSEAVNATTSSFTIECPAPGNLKTFTVSGSGTSAITLDPTVDLPVGTTCTVTVIAAQIHDSDANDPPDTMAANYVFSFTIDAPPSVSSTVPTDTATGVATNTTITVNFSESVNATTSSFTIKCPSGGAALPYTLSSSPSTSFTLTPNAALPAGTTCQVTVIAAQITDVDTADPPDQMVTNFVFNFTTDAAPSVTTTVPTNGANPVATNTNITVNFSEPVNATISSFTIECPAVGNLQAFTVTGSGTSTITLDPTADLPVGTVCTVTVIANQISDTDTNDPPDNMTANFVFSFTTDQAPSVTTTVPINGATNVALNATITVNFSESVAATGSSFTIVCTSAGSRAFTLSASPSTSFTLTPTGGLPAGDDCTVTVIANQISDTDTADPPDNMVTNFVFSFKVQPDAVNDTYPVTLVGNVSTNSFLLPYSVTTNDVSAAAFTISAVQANSTVVTNTITTTSTNGGNIVMTVSGTDRGKFTYDPPAGFEGTDTFTYTISRSDGGGSDTATVSVPVSGMIWFINNNASSCVVAGCGRLSNPFSTLAAFNTLNNGTGNNPAANDNIFVYESGTQYTGAVTLLSGQKLIGQDATASLSTITGLTPPSGSAAFPAMNSGNGTITNIGSTVTLNTNATVRGLSINSTTSTGMNDPAGAITGVSVSEVNVTTTTAAAVSLSSIAGTLSFQSINASAISGKGISVNGLTGSFTVTGTTNSLTSGGTITGGGAATATRGAEFINVTGGVSLSHMTFTNATQVDGGSDTTCGIDLINNNNTACNAPIHMDTVGTAVTLNMVSVNGSSQTGINGYDLRNLAMTSVTVTNAGNAGVEHGVVLKNLRGTNTITSSSFTGNRSRQLYAINTIDDSPNATPTLSITSSTFTGTGVATGIQGALFDSYNSGNIVVNVGDDTVAGANTFSNNFSNALQQSVGLGGDMTINIKRNTFNHKVSGIVLQAAGVGATSNLTYTIWHNTVVKTDLQTNNGSGAIIVSGTQQHQISGDIRSNTIGNGTAGSGAFCGGGCNGITVDHNDISAAGGGRHDVTIVGNIVRNVDSTGIRAVIGQKSKGNITITGNLIEDPDNSPVVTFSAIYVQGGIVAADPSCISATIGGTVNPGAWPSTSANAMNQILGSWDPAGFQSEIFVWRKNTSGGTFNIPGLVGSTNADVVAFLGARNNIPDATGADVTASGAPFGSGPSCPLLLAEGGVMAALNAPSLVSLWFSSLSTAPITIDARRSTSAVPSAVSTSLNQPQLDLIVLAATARWSATGLTPQQFASLRGLKFEVSDLSGSYLGVTDGNRILVDRNAQGKGWFVDANQRSDSGFSRAVSATRPYTDPMNAAAGHVDLLTAIEHEMGHKLGLPDTYAAKDRDSIMYGYLTVGERRLPAPGQARGVNPNALTGAHFLSLPSEVRGRRSEVRDQRSEVGGQRSEVGHSAIAPTTAPLAPPPPPTISQSIGTLKAGKTVHIQFQVTVNTPFPGGTTQVSNQGTVNYDPPGPPVLTDDPSVVGTSDPTVTPVQAAADAVDDNYNAFKNTPLNIAAPGVLANDSGGPTVSAVGGCADVTDPFSGCATTAGGTVTVNANGSFTYTPPSAVFTGADSFTYTATNATNSDTATVNITVSDTSAIFINEVLFNPPGTDAPNEYIELRGPASTVIPAGTYFVAIEGDAADNPGDVKTIINLSGLAFGSNGFLVLLQNGNTYTTTAGATVITSTTTGFGGLPGGIWSADSSATDLPDSSVTFMLIQTGAAPTLTDDIDANDDGGFDGSVYPGWSVRDSISAMNGSALARAYGAFSFRNTAGTGTGQGGEVIVPFIPSYLGRFGNSTGSTAADWVSSGALGGAAPNWTLGIATETEPTSLAGALLNHIGAANFSNQAPVNSVPGAQNTNEDTALTFNAANSNLISISDPDAGTNDVQVTLTATNGVISLSGTTGLAFSVGDGTADATMTFTGTIANINTALNGLTFTPTLNYLGPASLQIVTNDQGNTGMGGAQSDTDTINITVNGTNDPPVNTVPGAQSVSENGSLTFSAANSNAISIADIDAGTNAVQVQLTATNGVITLSGISGLSFTVGDGTADATMTFTGTIANINAALNGMVFTPTTGFSGAAALQIVTNDQGNTGSGGAQSDTDTVNITVNDGGTLQFSAATYSVSENVVNATITITRTGGTAGTATVQFSTATGGTATAGSDYTAVTNQTVTFNDGDTSKTVSVPITNDSLDENDETVNLTLSSAGGSGALGAPATAVLTINDDDAPPSLSIDDVSLAEGNSGTTTFTFTVTLSAASGLPVTVNYATANGTADASDYTAVPSTLLTFNAGDTSKTLDVLVNGDTLTEGNETFFVNLSSPTNATIADNQGLGTILTDDIPVIQFNAAVYTIDEGAVNTPEGFASLTVQVDRSGDLSGASTVRYATSDLSGNNECTITNGNASQRCDYLMLSGTLRFAAGESSKTFQVPIVNDGYVEGPEVFTIELSNVTGGTLGPTSLTTVGITDDDTVATDAAHNPYLSNSFFVRMHYVDFLEREPDTAGFNDWVGVLDGCGPQQGFLGAPAGCDRAHISQGFFGATEFIDRGFLVYRLYDVGLNRLPLYTEFNADAAELRGFGLTPAEQQQNLDNYLLELGARTEFVNRYAAVSATGQASQLIQLLETTAGVTLPATATTLPGQPPQYGRGDLISKRATGQFSVVETVKAFVEQQVVYDKYFPRGFVTMQYFAYLHRDPDTAGWNDWLDVLVNGKPSAGIAAGDYRHLIFGFIYSTEYRKRFGQP